MLITLRGKNKNIPNLCSLSSFKQLSTEHGVKVGKIHPRGCGSRFAAPSPPAWICSTLAPQFHCVCSPRPARAMPGARFPWKSLLRNPFLCFHRSSFAAAFTGPTSAFIFKAELHAEPPFSPSCACSAADTNTTWCFFFFKKNNTQTSR